MGALPLINNMGAFANEMEWFLQKLIQLINSVLLI
jgi:hypothetical protein